jgi:hypothetical protein
MIMNLENTLYQIINNLFIFFTFFIEDFDNNSYDSDDSDDNNEYRKELISLILD